MNTPLHPKQNSYTLLDCGSRQRLEQVGPFKIVRPAPQAEWQKKKPSLWKEPDAEYIREENGKGSWKKSEQITDEFVITINGIKSRIKFTEAGQLGIFPEQLENWLWLKSLVQRTDRPLKILNCFAYTGMATLFAAVAEKTEVTHADSSKAAVNWAKSNSELNGMENKPLRWIIEDVTKFIKREIKRGRKYDGIILDPPAFGRGPGNESWKLSRDLDKLIKSLNSVISDNPLFILLSCHDPELTSKELAGRIRTLNFPEGALLEHGELKIPASAGNDLPNGIYARISNQPNSGPAME
ncbi:MAG: class I SAM-dependent methyltransferase [Planctomycetota bacterium]|jgi:23S rRNA (cytosine1962-C5)-methyltransferase